MIQLLNYNKVKIMKNLIDRLVLGTVQLGLDYGINNSTGKPSRKASLQMLDFAYKKGIRIFDTASAYGDAEEILGEFMQSRKLTNKIKIITKLKPNIISESENDPHSIILENLQSSLKKLQRNYVDGYLFHTPEYIRDKKLVACFSKLKRQGLVKKIGVSVYKVEDAIYAAKLDAVDYIQVPYSIFNQYLNKTDFFKIAKKNKKTIFVRNVFLQGLFFMPENKIPKQLIKCIDYFRELDDILLKYNLTRQQAALLFCLKNKDINYIVFGVDNLDQLKEDINIVKNNINCKECIKELEKKFINIEEEVIFPSLWKK